jgi:hypothetical protein
MIRLHGRLCEYFTRRLTCQQSNEREHRLVGVSIHLPPTAARDGRHRSFALAFEPAASTVIPFVHA